MNRGKIAFKNSSIGLCSQIVALIFQIINRKVFITYLGVELLGLSSTLTSVLGMLALAELGFQSAIVFNLYRPIYERNTEYINSIVNIFRLIYRAIGIFFITASFLCLPLLKFIITDINLGKSSLYIYYVLQVMGSACTYFLAYKRTLLYADQKEYVSKLIDMIFNVVFSIIKIIFIIWYKNFTVYLILQLIQTYGSNIVVHLLCKKIYPYLHNAPIDRKLLKDILGNAKNVFASKIAAYIHGSTDSLVISMFISTITVGYLTNYTTITSNLNNLMQSALNPIAPIIGNVIADSAEQNNKKKVFLLYSHIRYILACIILIPTLILLTDFITFWVGNDYILSNIIVYLLVVDLYIHLVHSALCDYINGQGLFKYDKYIEIIGASINIILSIVLARIIGISGVLIGTVVSQIVFWIARSILVFKRCFNDKIDGLILYWGRNIYSIVIFFIIYLLCAFIYNEIQMDKFAIKFIITGIVCELIIIFIVGLAFLFTNEQKQINKILTKIFTKYFSIDS